MRVIYAMRLLLDGVVMIFNLRPGQLCKLLYSIKTAAWNGQTAAPEECMYEKCVQFVAIIKPQIIMMFPHLEFIHSLMEEVVPHFYGSH